MKTICPITGSDGCMEHECLFYRNEQREDGKHQCVAFTAIDFLADIVRMLGLLTRSTEGSRGLMEQSLLTQYAGEMTPELKTLLGINSKDKIEKVEKIDEI